MIQEVYRSNSNGETNIEELLSREELQSLRQVLERQLIGNLLIIAALEDFDDLERASQSLRLVIDRVLRQRLRYGGLVVLDTSQVNGNGQKCLKHAPLRGLLSGADMVLLPYDMDDQMACIQAIYAAFESSRLNHIAMAERAIHIREFLANSQAGFGARRPPRDHVGLLQQHADLTRDVYRSATTALSGASSPLLNLSTTSVLLLLTPSVPPLPISDTHSSSDPFEHLGRTIAGFHSRTRHVPYTLSAGLTSTHKAFLERAAAVILVLCNTSSAFNDAQAEFILNIQNQIRDIESRPGQQRIRKVLLAAGDPRDLEGPLEGWWEVCSYEYTPGALTAAAEVITGERRATGRLPVRVGRYMNSG